MRAFVPFAAEYDAHDLMVANPERESSSKRGVRGVKDDLRRIFIGPIPGQCRDLCAHPRRLRPPTASSSTPCSSARCPWRSAPRPHRPALACVGVMPYAVVQPRHRALRRRAPAGPGPAAPAAQRRPELGHRARRAGRHPALRPPPPGRGRARPALPGLLHRPASPRWSTPTCRPRWPGFEYPRSDLAPTVRFVGPDPRPARRRLRAARLVGRARRRAPGRPRHPGHARQRRPGPAAAAHHAGAGRRRRAGRGHHRRARPRAAARRACRPTSRLERFIPHDLLLPHVDVMVTNGGYGGVQQALANGVPLVVAGDSEDKPEVAARVQWSGAGVNLHTGRPSPAMVAAPSAASWRDATGPGAGAAGPDRRDRPLGASAALAELCAHGRRRPAPRLSGAAQAPGARCAARPGRGVHSARDEHVVRSRPPSAVTACRGVGACARLATSALVPADAESSAPLDGLGSRAMVTPSSATHSG